MWFEVPVGGRFRWDGSSHYAPERLGSDCEWLNRDFIKTSAGGYKPVEHAMDEGYGEWPHHVMMPTYLFLEEPGATETTPGSIPAPIPQGSGAAMWAARQHAEGRKREPRSPSQRRRDQVAADVRRLRRKIREHRQSAVRCASKGYADLVGTFEGLALGARDAAKAWLRYGRHFSKGSPEPAKKRTGTEVPAQCGGDYEKQPGLHTPNGLHGDGWARFHAKSTGMSVTGCAGGKVGAR